MHKEKSNVVGSVIVAYTIIMAILKWQNIISLEWIQIFLPLGIYCLIEIIISVLFCFIFHLANLKKNKKIRPSINGTKMYWDYKTQTMYGTPTENKKETRNNENDD